MTQKQDNLIVVLDVGSAWTRVLAAEVVEGVLRYRGHGAVESAGMRKGLIAELSPAARVVRSANEQAERIARVNIAECVVGVGGPHIRGLNTNGGFELGNRMREITRDDAGLYPFGNVGILFNDRNPNTRSHRIRVIGSNDLRRGIHWHCGLRHGPHHRTQSAAECEPGALQ